MFIETEPTPNPATLKFLPGRAVMAKGTADFPSRESANPSPLAEKLFEIPGVSGVFLGGDFITVSADGGDWRELKAEVLSAIMEHFASGLPVVDPSYRSAGGADAGDDELVTEIKELLDRRVRPAIAQDGGDIVFERFSDGVVYLHMQGACSGCPSSVMTLKHGIENLLRHYIPEVREVRQV